MKDYPAVIKKMAGDAGLGEVVDRYRQSVLVEMELFFSFAGLGLVGLLFGDDVGRTIGAVFCGLASPWALIAWVRARMYLYLCSDGLLTTSSKTTLRILCAWEDVAYIRLWTTRIYQIGPFEDFQRCILVLEDGMKLDLGRPSYAKGEDLIAAVEERMAATIYPRRAAEISELGDADFDQIIVTADGIRDGDRFVSWSAITGMKRGRVRLRIWSGPGRPVISRKVKWIPDIKVLQTLISEGVQRARAQGAGARRQDWG
ncbi:DUF6585 family protein [Sphaerisporangium aureirubrum]|uniref:DUF6585 family protein n=1 Tax=Sphaerisporangium aureirubrum TaxID=1544736 RepID=A0ABW1NRL1_9ACTN